MAYIHCSKTAVDGLQDGSDWQNAYLTLEEALFAANTLSTDEQAIVLIDGDIYDLGTFTITRSITILGSQGPSSRPLSKTIINFDQININITSGLVERVNIESCHWVTNDPGLAGFNIDSVGTELILYFKYNSVSGYRFMHSETDPVVYFIDSQINVTDLGIEGTYNTIDLYNTVIGSNNYTIDVEAETIVTNISKILSSNIALNVRYSTNQVATILNNTLLKAPTCINYLNPNSDALELTSCTIDGDVIIGTQVANDIRIRSSIMLGDVPNSGDAYGSIVYLDNAYLTEPVNPTYEADNRLLTKRPNFVNEQQGDYELLHGIAETLEPFELLLTNEFYDFTKYSQRLKQRTDVNYLEPFSYKFGNALSLSDYGKEKLFADTVYFNKYNTIDNTVDYEAFATKTFIIENTRTVGSFNPTNSGVQSLWPYEWDYSNIDMPGIEKKRYIVPRSIVDITDVIRDEFNATPETVSLSKFKATAVKHKDYKGIAYDYSISDRTNKRVWILDEQNNLTLVNVHTGELLKKYPMFRVNVGDNSFWIKPSGVLPFAKTENGYNYFLEDKPNIIIEGVDEDGNFEWFPTHISPEYNPGGLVAYKDHLYVGVQYTTSGQTDLLIYPSKGHFDDYTQLSTHRVTLSSGVIQNDIGVPSDITVLEDGTFLVSNSESNNLKHYQPKYDYALIKSAGTLDTQILLREQYDDVQL